MGTIRSNNHIFHILFTVGIVQERITHQNWCIHELAYNRFTYYSRFWLYDPTKKKKQYEYVLLSKLYTSRRSN